jgi:hypothetical protein
MRNLVARNNFFLKVLGYGVEMGGEELLLFVYMPILSFFIHNPFHVTVPILAFYTT